MSARDPWIVRTGILDHKTRFVLLVLLPHGIWAMLAVAAGLGYNLLNDLTFYSFPIMAIIIVFLLKKIWKNFLLLSDDSKSGILRPLFDSDGEHKKFVDELKKLVYSTKERWLIISLSIVFFFGGLAIYGWNITAITMYDAKVTPVTYAGGILGLAVWTLILLPIMSSATWVQLSIMVGISKIGKCKLKIQHTFDDFPNAFLQLRLSLEPLIRIILLISITVIIFSAYHAVSVFIIDRQLRSNDIEDLPRATAGANWLEISRFISITLVCVAIFVFVFPQLALRRVFADKKREALLMYKNKLFNAIEGKIDLSPVSAKGSAANPSDIRRDFYDTKSIDTWPFELKKIGEVALAAIGTPFFGPAMSLFLGQ